MFPSGPRLRIAPKFPTFQVFCNSLKSVVNNVTCNHFRQSLTVMDSDDHFSSALCKLLGKLLGIQAGWSLCFLLSWLVREISLILALPRTVYCFPSAKLFSFFPYSPRRPTPRDFDATRSFVFFFMCTAIPQTVSFRDILGPFRRLVYCSVHCLALYQSQLQPAVVSRVLILWAREENWSTVFVYFLFSCSFQWGSAAFLWRLFRCGRLQIPWS